MTEENRAYKSGTIRYMNDLIRSMKDEKAIIADLERRVRHHKSRVKSYFEPTIKSARKTILEIK